MKYLEKADNVYVLDTNMFNFQHYSSSFLVEGKELALIDTGLPDQYDTLKKTIEKHGFSLEEIEHIFLTHCEHPDHSGNAGRILRDNPKAKLYINPVGAECLIDPSIENEKRKAKLKPEMTARFAPMTPVPKDRIEFVDDGDIFDLGDGVRLRVIYAAGHQPSGIVIHEEKYNGLFINDLVGNYFADADDFLVALVPSDGSDLKKSMASLRMLRKMLSPQRLFLGHFGISEDPQKVFDLALADMQTLMEIGEECMKAGKPGDIEPRVLAHKMQEGEKLRKPRGKVLYDYVQEELNTHQAVAFSEYYQKLYGKDL